MTEAQIINLVLRHADRTTEFPDELTAHPATILRLVLAHSLPAERCWIGVRPAVRLTVLGVPVMPDDTARRGTISIRQRIRPPRGIPCS